MGGGNAPTSGAWILGVYAATGGLGASSLAVALSQRLSDAGAPTLLVEVDPWSVSVRCQLALDQSAGLAWEDLSGLKGEVDAHALAEELPKVGEVAVLTWRAPSNRYAAQASVAVAQGLGQWAEVVICDLPHPQLPGSGQWWGLCHQRALLVGDRVDAMAAALQVADDLAPTWLVVRKTGSGLSEDDIAAALNVPVIASIAADKSVNADLVAGVPIGRRGALVDCADRLLSAGWPRLQAAAL